MSKSVTARKRTRSRAGTSSPTVTKQQPKPRTKSPVPTVGCLFSAIGGFAAAFGRSGAKVVWANEKDAQAVATFRHNFPDVECMHKSVEELTVAGDELEAVDVLTAGFVVGVYCDRS